MARPKKTIAAWQFDAICNSGAGARTLARELGLPSPGLASLVKKECSDPVARALRIGISPENVPQVVPPVSDSPMTGLAITQPANTIANVRMMTGVGGRKRTSASKTAATTEQLNTVTPPPSNDADDDVYYDYLDDPYSLTSLGNYYTPNFELLNAQPQFNNQLLGSRIANLPNVIWRIWEDQLITKTVHDFIRNLEPAYTPANVPQEAPLSTPSVAKPTPSVGNYQSIEETESSPRQHSDDSQKSASYVDSDAIDDRVDNHARSQSYVSSDTQVTPPSNPPSCKNICTCPSGNESPRRIGTDQPTAGGERQESQSRLTTISSPSMPRPDSIERENSLDTQSQGENHSGVQSIDNTPNVSRNVSPVGTNIVQIFVASCQRPENILGTRKNDSAEPERREDQGSHESEFQGSNFDAMATEKPQTIPSAMTSTVIPTQQPQELASAKTQAEMQSTELTDQVLNIQSTGTQPDTRQAPLTISINSGEKPLAALERTEATKCPCSDQVPLAQPSQTDPMQDSVTNPQPVTAMQLGGVHSESDHGNDDRKLVAVAIGSGAVACLFATESLWRPRVEEAFKWLLAKLTPKSQTTSIAETSPTLNSDHQGAISKVKPRLYTIPTTERENIF